MAGTKILVIKLGALGDVVQALGPMRAIRDHHPDAHITVLTSRPFVELLTKTGLFNAVHVDDRPRWHDATGWLKLVVWFNRQNFDRVYDLQNNDRTFFYFRLFLKKPDWVGAVRGASHRNDDPNRSAGHAFDGHVQTLGIGGVQGVRVDDLSWLESDLSALDLPQRYAVLVPGSAPQHPGKRWPHFAALAQALLDRKIMSVLVGTKAEELDILEIQAKVPQCVSLVGKTRLWDLPQLARGAECVLGNDTGPMHIMAPTGVRMVVIMGPLSNPDRHYPLGPRVYILSNSDLSALTPQAVLTALDNLA